MKYVIICMTLKLRVLILMLYNGSVKLGLKKSMTCDTTKGVSISLCMKFSIRAYFLIRTRNCYIQEGKIISKNYINFDDLKILKL